MLNLKYKQKAGLFKKTKKNITEEMEWNFRENF